MYFSRVLLFISSAIVYPLTCGGVVLGLMGVFCGASTVAVIEEAYIGDIGGLLLGLIVGSMGI